MRDLMVRSCTIGMAALIVCLLLTAEGQTGQASRVVEIRSYNLKPGTRDRFHQLVEREALPMLRRWKVDVVTYGPSLHDGDSYYLMRSFASLEDRQRSEDAFYGSDEWRQGPREAILACIESYTTIVIRLDDGAFRGLRSLEVPRRLRPAHGQLRDHSRSDHLHGARRAPRVGSYTDVWAKRT